MKRLFFLLITTVLVLSCTYKSPEDTTEENTFSEQEIIEDGESEEFESTEEQQIVSHYDWGDVLMRYVTAEGEVDYEGLKNNREDRIIMEKYMEILQQNHPNDTWPKAEEIAYWINLYNFFTIEKVLENFPINSVTEIDQGKMWDTKFIEIEDTVYTLNQIEKDILLKKFEDPRIHMAINCASFSCPILFRTNFDADYLDDQLEEVTKVFIRDKARNQITKKDIKISKIFEWYEADFVKSSGSVIKFINKYSEVKVKSKAKISYMDYNWSLNAQGE